MQHDPDLMHHMILTSIWSYVLLTNQALTQQSQSALRMIHVSSIASDLMMPWGSLYAGTKRFNEVFAS
jgi:NADP-dependent 3-hydroxy acid dehydrogenase YdfG